MMISSSKISSSLKLKNRMSDVIPNWIMVERLYYYILIWALSYKCYMTFNPPLCPRNLTTLPNAVALVLQLLLMVVVFVMLNEQYPRLWIFMIVTAWLLSIVDVTILNWLANPSLFYCSKMQTLVHYFITPQDGPSKRPLRSRSHIFLPTYVANRFFDLKDCLESLRSHCIIYTKGLRDLKTKNYLVGRDHEKTKGAGVFSPTQGLTELRTKKFVQTKGLKSLFRQMKILGWAPALTFSIIEDMRFNLFIARHGGPSHTAVIYI